MADNVRFGDFLHELSGQSHLCSGWVDYGSPLLIQAAILVSSLEGNQISNLMQAAPSMDCVHKLEIIFYY